MRRLRLVYGIPTLPVDQHGHVIPGLPPVVGYIGKSRQTVFQREQQHRDEKPFSDIIFGGAFVIEEGWWTEAELDAHEQWWIRNGVALLPGGPVQRPIYNYEFNTDNPDRVEIWRQVEQRQAREPGWQPPVKGEPRIPRQRNHRAAPVRPSAAPSRLARLWATYRTPITVWGILWLGLFAAVWWAGADAWTGWHEPRNAGVGAALGLGGLAYAYRRAADRGRRERRRAKRRRSRR